MGCSVGVQPDTGKMQEENEQDQTDDPEEHVPAPGRDLSSRGRSPRRGLFVLFADPYCVMPQGLYTESAVVISNTNRAAQASPTS